MNPLPWSYSSLKQFVTCPWWFKAQYVDKSIPKQPEGPEQKLGLFVHKQFEDYVKTDGRKPLDPSLVNHLPYLDSLRAAYGKKSYEMRWGLNKQLEPVEFFASDVWARGVIDQQREYHFKDMQDDKIIRTGLKLVDYKTGKKKYVEEKQLKLFALYGFATGASLVQSEFYWTDDYSTTKHTYSITERNAMWGDFIPDLNQYAEAFKTDTWQKRPNGLCHGWCPRTDCNHWKPKKVK